ncbi:MAG: substrate-binding domain-containing protein [Verrucomicrobiota bacterium]
MRPPFNSYPHLLIYATSRRTAYFESIVRGIIEYSNLRARFQLFYHLTEAALDGALDQAPGCDAIIGHLAGEDLEIARRSGKPLVLVEQDPVEGVPVVRADNVAVGRMAYEHLAAKGFTRYAYCGIPGQLYSQEREQGFFDAARQAGHGIHVAPSDLRAVVEESAADWIESLPRPIGVLIHNALHARDIIFALGKRGVLVPEEVAILGVDEDTTLCETSIPPLTSVDQGCLEIGRRAAAILHGMLGDPAIAPPPLTLVPPVGVIERQSTDILAVHDPHVARALRYIAVHFSERINAADVCKQVPVARRTLEAQFADAMGRGIYQEILRRRIEHAKKLLARSDMLLSEIALECGMEWGGELTRIFKKLTGETPSQYRKAHTLKKG